jgi:hypothetical protein
VDQADSRLPRNELCGSQGAPSMDRVDQNPNVRVLGPKARLMRARARVTFSESAGSLP